MRGRSIGAARRILKTDEEFETRVIGPLSDSDIVTMQSPSPGTELERGRSVTLDARVAVPNLYRRSVSNAARIVRASGGDLRFSMTNGSGPRDVVYSQNHSPGSLVYPRTTITVTPGVVIPNLTGMTRSQVHSTLTALGVRGRIVGTSRRETTNRSLIGRTIVASQDLSPGRIYARGSFGELRIGMVHYVQRMVIVPDLTYERGEREYTLRAAIAILSRAGLKYRTLPGATPNLIVYNQSPRAGSRVPVGTTVFLDVD